jgi:hypothetical protein
VNMGNRNNIGIFLSVLAALLACSSGPVAADGPPVRIGESFELGDTGCQMNLAVAGDEVIAADISPAFEPPPEPPPTYSFTGQVHSITGVPPFGIAPNDSFSGTLTYSSSTFALRDPTERCPDSECKEYIPRPDGSTIARMSITYSGSQFFQTEVFGSSAVIDDRTVDDIHVDMYDFYSASLSSNPRISGNGNVRSVFFLRDDSGNALDNTDYPANLADQDWPTIRSVQVYVPGGASNIWAINGALASLSPVFSASPAPAPPPIVPPPPPPGGQPGPAVCQGTLVIGSIRDTLLCENCTENEDGSFTCDKANCAPKTAVERNTMEKSGNGSTYCYYTTTRQRVCKTL